MIHFDISESDAVPDDETTLHFRPHHNESLDQSCHADLHRHCKRRYDILSKLLLSSAQLLRLERSQAKAFLPMLSNLLVPTKKSRKRQRTSTMDKNYDIEHLGVFLESMTPGAGFRCLTMFLIQHLLHSPDGYDARVRHGLKRLGVILLVHDMEKDPVDVAFKPHRRKRSKTDLIALATRKFESLEHWIARELLLLSNERGKREQRPRRPTKSVAKSDGLSREQVLRRLKIGGTAVVAGTLFAGTGLLAAPGIAAGLAAFAGGTAATAAAAAVLTSTAAVTAIFGVGGGSLAAYKMQRRTQGLTEFAFNKVSGRRDGLHVEAELFSTICLSGWLRDKHDFQRPWGVMPSNPPLRDRLELLERFYAVYKPLHVTRSARILEHWRGEEDQLWKLLEQKYGRNPSNLYPFGRGPRFRAALTLEQKEVIAQLFVELGCEPQPSSKPPQSTPFELMRWGWKKHRPEQEKASESQALPNQQPSRSANLLDTSFGGSHVDEFASVTTVTAEASSLASSGFEGSSTSLLSPSDGRDELRDEPEVPKHVATVWDYEANYGGELYTVKWESELLSELCDSVADLAFELVSGGTAQLLRHTAALSTLLSAFAWPYALVNAANMIDGTWTLAVERSDAAGKELARSLLFSSAGHRPVTLVGYSFGARAIYSCLKELARYQELWEDEEERRRESRKPLVRATASGSSTPAAMREPASIVEDAILMGLPNHLSKSSWKACRQVVAGRLVNCYSQKDLILSLMFQVKRFGGLKPVCGVCAVNVGGVENIDVTDLISGHQDYCLNSGDILKRVRHGQPFASPQEAIRPPDPQPRFDDVTKLDI